jgi:cytochrome c peroxidase
MLFKLGSLALACVASVGCIPGKGMVDVFTDEEFEQIRQFGPLGDVPPSPTNRYADDPAAAAFGQRLFFEKSYSHALTISGSGLGNVGDKGKISCASCHDPAGYYSDSRSRPNATSLGVSWTARNSPTLVNAAFYTWGSWGGKDDVLWNQGANGSESSPNFASNRLELAHIVFRKYRADYDAIFPVPLDPALDPAAPDAARFPPQGRPKSGSAAPDGPWEAMTAADRALINQIAANTGKALEAYERQLVSRNAPIDRYIAGDHEALSPSAKRGLSLFMGKAACVDCHSGPLFSDQEFHNTGVSQTGATQSLVDNGRFDDLTRTLANTFNGAGAFSDDQVTGIAKLEGMVVADELKGQFRTSSLRHIARTGPYMHAGTHTTLEDVVRFYNWGGASSGFAGTKSAAMVPLLLSDEEELDLVALMKALTGEPVAAELTVDTALAD